MALVLSVSVTCVLAFEAYERAFLFSFLVFVALVRTRVSAVIIAYVRLISLLCFVLSESGTCLLKF